MWRGGRFSCSTTTKCVMFTAQQEGTPAFPTLDMADPTHFTDFIHVSKAEVSVSPSGQVRGLTNTQGEGQRLLAEPKRPEQPSAGSSMAVWTKQICRLQTAPGSVSPSTLPQQVPETQHLEATHLGGSESSSMSQQWI